MSLVGCGRRLRMKIVHFAVRMAASDSVIAPQPAS